MKFPFLAFVTTKLNKYVYSANNQRPLLEGDIMEAIIRTIQRPTGVAKKKKKKRGNRRKRFDVFIFTWTAVSSNSKERQSFTLDDFWMCCFALFISHHWSFLMGPPLFISATTGPSSLSFSPLKTFNILTSLSSLVFSFLRWCTFWTVQTFRALACYRNAMCVSSMCTCVCVCSMCTISIE